MVKMTVRTDLVAQVKKAIIVASGVAPDDYDGMATAAVDAVAVYVYEQLASGD
jgi:hypothetical protein